MWRCFLCDTADGRLRSEIDVPSFSWTVTVSDCSFDTTNDKGTGEGEVSKVTLSWMSLPGSTADERGAAVATGRRGMVLCWDDGDEMYPIVMGAIGERTDTYYDTSFTLDSPMTILGSRYLIAEDTFGADTTTTVDEGDEDDETDDVTTTIYGTTTSEYILTGSWRGIAAEVGTYCTSYKPGGALPIDWQYFGESGGHTLTVYGYDVNNASCSGILEDIANDGPDLQFRPYMYDDSHVHWKFMGGTDDGIYLGQDSEHYLSEYNDLQVEHSVPYQRVYGTGAGSETEMVCYLAEDLDLCTSLDPVPLRETEYHDSDDETAEALETTTEAYLEAYALPLCQVSCSVAAEVLPLGKVWPGETIRVPIDDFPTLPSGDYNMRLMEMSGDEGQMVDLVFDVMEDPTY